MEKKIQGVHHIAIKPTPAQYEKTVDFYTRLLGMEIVQKWGDDPQHPKMFVSCGDNTCIEILSTDTEIAPGGPLCHIAFATQCVDELIEAVRAEGYPVKVEPRDGDLGGKAIRIAFCYGPVGEEIEFFCVKG